MLFFGRDKRRPEMRLPFAGLYNHDFGTIFEFNNEYYHCDCLLADMGPSKAQDLSTGLV